MYLYRPVLISIMSGFLLMACHTDNKQELSDNFASGNLGRANKASILDSKVVIQLANDNHNDVLESRPLWRNWWYFKLDNITTTRNFTILINDIFQSTNQGWQYNYTPVYSYDQRNWHRFDENQLTAATSTIDSNYLLRQITIDAKFDKPSVYVARFYPYTQDDFEHYYQNIAKEHQDKFDQGYIQRETLGYSCVHHLAIDMLTITDPNVSENQKKRIWIQARTHPAETGGSFVVEGIINWLLDDSSADVDYALSHFIFNIVPIHNPDGVFEGNYRTNSLSQNLENSWKRSGDPMVLTQDSPKENQILNREMRKLSNSNSPFIVALNLHSTQSPADRKAFFFPHFGPASLNYQPEEVRLWNNSLRFINGVRKYYVNDQGEPLIEANPAQGGTSFVTNSYPESWWWANFGANVMAVTLETTYEKAGYQQGFVTPARLHKLGAALMKSLVDYHRSDSQLTEEATEPEQWRNSQSIMNRPTEDETKR